MIPVGPFGPCFRLVLQKYSLFVILFDDKDSFMDFHHQLYLHTRINLRNVCLQIFTFKFALYTRCFE